MGYGKNGRLGVGNSDLYTDAVILGSLSSPQYNIKYISCGSAHSFAWN